MPQARTNHPARSRAPGLQQPQAASQPYADPNRWYTLEEAAEYLRVPVRRMRRWVYNGSVGSSPLPGGRGRRISGAHLNAAMGLDEH